MDLENINPQSHADVPSNSFWEFRRKDSAFGQLGWTAFFKQSLFMPYFILSTAPQLLRLVGSP